MKMKRERRKPLPTSSKNMEAGRTFSKWLWTALHNGAAGTFVLRNLDPNGPESRRMFVIKFSLILYGLFEYNGRKRALRTGLIEHVLEFMREFSPTIAVAALGVEMGLALIHSFF